MAQRGTQPVKMEINGKQETVATATFAIYENVEEAIGDLGEEKTLEYINSMTKTNEMNRVRGLERALREGGGSKVLREKAFARLGPEDFAGVIGNPEAFEALLRKKIEEVKAELNLAPQAS